MTTVSQDESRSMIDHVIITTTCMEFNHTTIFACKMLHSGLAIIEYTTRGWPNYIQGGLTISRWPNYIEDDLTITRVA